jgi:uncharacterized protein
MKMKLLLALLCMAFANLSGAQSTAPASEASINELLTVMNARSVIDNMVPQMQGMVRNMVQQVSKDMPPSAEQQAKMDKALAQMTKLYTEEFTWEKMQPMYVRIYQASFSQDEVDGMLAFYRSPAGQATIKKMPLVMQNTMLEMQQMMKPIIQKIQAMAREAQAAEKSESKAPVAESPKQKK